jgi:hypothetical protein
MIRDMELQLGNKTKTSAEIHTCDGEQTQYVNMFKVGELHGENSIEYLSQSCTSFSSKLQAVSRHLLKYPLVKIL